MNLGGTILDSERQEAMIDKDEYIKSLEISVQLLQREIETLRSRLIDNHPVSSTNKSSGESNYVQGFMGCTSNEELMNRLSELISSIDGFLEAELFHYDKDGLIASYLDDQEISKLFTDIKEMEESGILDWVIKQNDIKIIPSLNDTTESTALNFVIYPINPKSAHSNLFVVKSSLDENSIDKDLKDRLILIAESAAISIDNIISADEIRKINKKLSNAGQRTNSNSINEIIRSLTDEIKDPVKIIKGNLDFVKTGIGDTKRRVEIIEKELGKLEDLGKKISHLISDSNSNKKVILKDLIKDLKFITRSQLRRDGIKIQINDDESDIELDISRNDLEQLLLTIILSSRDMMPDGGTISISFSTGENNVSITLHHDGVGFTKEELFEILNSSEAKLLSNKSFSNHQFVQSLAENIGINFEMISDTNTGTSYKLSFEKI